MISGIRLFGVLTTSALLLAPAAALVAPASAAPAAGAVAGIRPGAVRTSSNVAPVTAAGASNLYGWGSSEHGALTDAAQDSATVLRPITLSLPSGTLVTQVSAGSDGHSTALTSSGRLLQWGQMLDYSPDTPDYVPPMLKPTWVDLKEAGYYNGLYGPPPPATFVSTGEQHSTVVAGGRAFSWGFCTNGDLGGGQLFACMGGGLVPGAVVGIPAADRVVSVASGNQYALALTARGTVYAWGNIPIPGYPRTPFSYAWPETLLPPDDPITALSGSVLTALALGRSGKVYAIGVYQELDDAGHVPSVAGLPPIASIAVGEPFAAAVTITGEVYTWQPEADSIRPVKVKGFPPGVRIAQVAVGDGGNAVARSTTGQVYTWGDDTEGQLGNGTQTVFGTVPGTTPVHVTGFPAGTVITDVAAGDSDVLAVAAPPTVTAAHFPQTIRVRPSFTLPVSVTFDEAVQSAQLTLSSASGNLIGHWNLAARGRTVAAVLPLSGAQMVGAGLGGTGRWTVQAGPGPTQATVAVAIRADSRIGVIARRRGPAIVIRGRLTQDTAAGARGTAWTGQPIDIQRWTAAGWRTIRATRSDSKGRFGVELPIATRVGIRVTVGATPQVWGAVSPARVIGGLEK